MMGVQIWRGLMQHGWSWRSPVRRKHILGSYSFSSRYYRQIDALTAQGVKFP